MVEAKVELRHRAAAAKTNNVRRHCFRLIHHCVMDSTILPAVGPGAVRWQVPPHHPAFQLSVTSHFAEARRGEAGSGGELFQRFHEFPRHLIKSDQSHSSAQLISSLGLLDVTTVVLVFVLFAFLPGTPLTSRSAAVLVFPTGLSLTAATLVSPGCAASQHGNHGNTGPTR